MSLYPLKNFKEISILMWRHAFATLNTPLLSARWLLIGPEICEFMSAKMSTMITSIQAHARSVMGHPLLYGLLSS